MEKLFSNPLAYCLFSALMFGIWPALGRMSGLNAAYLSLTVALSGIVVGVLSIPYFQNNTTTYLSLSGLLLGLLAGVLNGIGIVSYSKLISWEGGQISVLITITTIMMTVVIFLSGCFLYGEPFTFKKIMGVCMAALAIYLLTSR